jgi:fumarate reductase subunit C
VDNQSLVSSVVIDAELGREDYCSFPTTVIGRGLELLWCKNWLRTNFNRWWKKKLSGQIHVIVSCAVLKVCELVLYLLMRDGVFFISTGGEIWRVCTHFIQISFISFHENKSLKIIMQRLQLTNIIKNVHTLRIRSKQNQVITNN